MTEIKGICTMVEVEQRRYADYITLQELERLRVENQQLREALKDIDGQMRQADRYFLKESTLAALQQKDSE